MTNPITFAFKSKGRLALIKRARSIAKRYSLTPIQMDRALQQFSDVLQRFDCGATLPITAVTLKRHSDTITKYLDKNFEFAVHGFTHVDYSHLAPELQGAHLQLARQVFTQAGINPTGFRSPYLSRESNLNSAIKSSGYSYVSNQPILWDVIVPDALNPFATTGYEQAVAFYNPWRIGERLSLPLLKDQLVEIPVSLPDDEILIDRLGGANDIVKETWLRILSQSYKLGELFTLQLHPERIKLCADGLLAVLSKACALTPKVWCARLDEIATWWKARSEATIEVSTKNDGEYHCIVNGPNGTTVLARAVQVNIPSSPWMNGYRALKATHFNVQSPMRPFIGVSPSTSIELLHFLRQQGFLVEISQESMLYSCFIDQVNYDGSQERAVLDKIEGTGCSLIRLGRWPDGAQSALAVTGDIDALTLWDYGLRLIGK